MTKLILLLLFVCYAHIYESLIIRDSSLKYFSSSKFSVENRIKRKNSILSRNDNIFQSTKAKSHIKCNLFLAPQIVFAASCAGAVFSYVYFNIDSIREVCLFV
jgi:hypothetical protein